MANHPHEVRCTGNPQTCRVPHNRWLIESTKQGRPVPVRGLTPPDDLVLGDLLSGRD